MNNLPRLINEKIGWYQWKAKIAKLNIDFKRKSFYSMNKLTVWFKDNTFYDFHYRESQLDPKHEDIFIRHIDHKGYHTYVVNVAILPSKYYFTSGSHNSQGFLSKKCRHNRLPDFCQNYYD
ncbi:MAG: hypothetical protein WD512_12355 [Candidatus Paceibacterota bacterium]